MRVTDRSPTGRRLQTVFIPAEPKPVMPTEVSDEIVLTHPVMPPMVGLKEGRFFFQQVQGAVGAIEVSGALVPTDRYWWIQVIQFFHNDTVTLRSLRLSMQDSIGNRVAIRDDTPAIDAIVMGAIQRPFLLPNDTRLVLSAPAIGAAFFLQMRFFFLEFLHAEINPTA